MDLKTAWVIEGLAHGHQDLAEPDAAAVVLWRDGSNIVGNAAVREYQEITSENFGSFHLHGDVATFPITAVIAVVPDRKSETLFLGRYQSHEQLQLLRPMEVVDTLLATVLHVVLPMRDMLAGRGVTLVVGMLGGGSERRSNWQVGC